MLQLIKLMLQTFCNSCHCLIITIFSSNLSLSRQIFFPALAEDSLSKVVYIWRCSTVVCMDGGWFFKREINNSEGSAENVTQASFRTLPRHVNEKKPREHILTSTIKNIVHILSGSPLLQRMAARVVFAHLSRLQTCFGYARDRRNYSRHTYATLYMLYTYVTTARRATYATSCFISSTTEKECFPFLRYPFLVCENNNSTYECWINSIHEPLRHLKIQAIP